MERQLLTILCLVSLAATCQAADPHCFPTDATLEEKINHNANLTDNNHDGLITTSDVHHLEDLYDHNQDGFVTEREFAKSYSCAVGATIYFARYNFNLISQGKANLTREDFTEEPFASGVPRAQYIEVYKQRYQEFESSNCTVQHLDVEQKLVINFGDNDHDNNQLVTSADIAHDLDNNYDTNEDGKVTEFEWVMRWICRYGDSGDYARFVWNMITHGAASMQASQFTGPPFDTGIPMAQFKAQNRDRYVKWAALHSSIVG